MRRQCTRCGSEFRPYSRRWSGIPSLQARALTLGFPFRRPPAAGDYVFSFHFPIRIGPAADEVLKCAEQFVIRLAAAHSRQLTVEHTIAVCGHRVHPDAFRNGAVQTVVSPYSVRRRPHAPVSTPLGLGRRSKTFLRSGDRPPRYLPRSARRGRILGLHFSKTAKPCEMP